MGDGKGFTLLESMIGMILLTVIALGTASAMLQSRAGTSGTRDTMIAAGLIEKKFAELKTKGARSLSVTTVPGISQLFNTTTGGKDILPNGVMSVEISQPETNRADWKRATVAVGWDRPTKGRIQHATVSECDKQLTMETFFFQE